MPSPLEQISFRIPATLKEQVRKAVADDWENKRSQQTWLSPYVELAIRAALEGRQPASLLGNSRRRHSRTREQSGSAAADGT